MSVTVIIVPVVVSSWPTILPALVAAAGALGFKAARSEGKPRADTCATAEVSVRNSSVVGAELTAGQELVVAAGGVTLRFFVDEQRRCRVHVSGSGRSREELEELGQRAADKVVQMFAYHRLVNEARQHGFELVREEVDEQGAIRLRLRRS